MVVDDECLCGHVLAEHETSGECVIDDCLCVSFEQRDDEEDD